MAAATRPLRILTRDCIESYLVEPQSSRAVNAVAVRREGSGCDASAVEDILSEVTDEMKDAAVDRAADRYSKVKRRATRQLPEIAEANARPGLVDAHWTTLDESYRRARKEAAGYGENPA